MARRLAESEELCKTYFDMKSKLFDPQIFDLYAEIGPHGVIKDRVIADVGQSLESIVPLLGEKHILLSNDVATGWEASGSYVARLQKRLKKAVSDVEAGRSDREDKQRLLDLRERIERGRAARTRAAVREHGGGELETLYEAVNSFQIGVMLLSSGAEALQAEEKRKLARQLVELASAIVDVWTRRIKNVDFEAFRKECLSDEFIDECAKLSPEKTNATELKRIITSLVDALEGPVLSTPLRQILGLVCEGARAGVLAKSLIHVNTETEVQELVRSAWLADIDTEKGKGDVDKVARKLPKVRFLRMTMAMHCLSRAFWSHWDRKSQLSLLDLANGFLRPLAVKFDKKVVMDQMKLAKD